MDYKRWKSASLETFGGLSDFRTFSSRIFGIPKLHSSESLKNILSKNYGRVFSGVYVPCFGCNLRIVTIFQQIQRSMATGNSIRCLRDKKHSDICFQIYSVNRSYIRKDYQFFARTPCIFYIDFFLFALSHLTYKNIFSFSDRKN